MLSLIICFMISHTCYSCFPGPLGLGYGPVLPPPVYYPNPGIGPFMNPRIMPARSEQHISPHASDVVNRNRPRVEMMLDEAHPVSALSCPLFVESNNCRWRNSGEDELDWAPVNRVTGADQWFPYLEVQTFPDQFAGALISGPRQGWEGGRLESDAMPCIGEGIRLTATVWRSKNSDVGNEPKIQVCTRNQGEERMPLINCVDFEIRNGVPMTVDVAPANDLHVPAQIVINGYNFMGPAGGALFLQDIVLQGTTSCSYEEVDNAIQSQDHEDIMKPTIIDTAVPNIIFRDVQRGDQALVSINSPAAIVQKQKSPSMHNFESNPTLISSLSAPATQGLKTNAPTLFESCMALACNPSDLNCKFWRSSGVNLWEIGTANRAANPLTGITSGPGTVRKFLVASFMDANVNNYILVSDAILVPEGSPTYFCFYEYFATEGLTLSICTSSMDCFYRKNNLTMSPSVDENRKWNIRCPQLPSGFYQIRVIAENRGQNKGEAGFLPIRLSRDPEGLDFIC